MSRLLLLSLFILLFCCRLDPKYQAPKIEAPLIIDDRDSKKKISEILWQEFFLDDDLKRIIEIVIKNNRDLKIADLNLELAKKNHAISISNLLPQVELSGNYDRQGVPRVFNNFFLTRQYRLNANLLSYELDFFGKLRSLKESALQDYFATQEARKIIKLSLIYEAVDAYLQLILDREILAISEDISLLNRGRYKLILQRYKNGIAKVSDSLAAKIDYENAKISYDDYLNLVEIDKNNLLRLMASYDQKLLPGESLKLLKIKASEDLLEFVASDALLQRPDVKMAEYNLKSQNAKIGAARAAFFPSISLSANYGYTSVELNDLFNNRTWIFSPSINLPIFRGGLNKANLDIAKLRKIVQIENYENVIQISFEETKNALEERKRLAFQTKSYAKILGSKYRLYKIARKNKKYGYASSIDVIEAKLEYLLARKSYLTSEKDYFMSLAKIYKAFGGGSIL